MVMANTQPVYPARYKAPNGSFGTANTNRDGTGTLQTIYTCPATIEFAIVETLGFVGVTDPVTDGMLRLYVTDTAGANPKLIREIPVQAIDPSNTIMGWHSGTRRGATVAAESSPVIVLNEPLEPGQILKVGTAIGETFAYKGKVAEY